MDEVWYMCKKVGLFSNYFVEWLSGWLAADTYHLSSTCRQYQVPVDPC